MVKDGQTIDSFSRDIAFLPKVFDFVDRFLQNNNISGENAYAITLAVEELFTNSIKYVGATGPIELSLNVDGRRVKVVYRDSGGPPFDVTQAGMIDPARPTSEIRPGGLGLHLIRNVMDEVDYRYENNTNTITMTRKLE